MNCPRFTANAGRLAAWVAACCLAAPAADMVFVPEGSYLRGRSHSNPDAALGWYPNPLKDDTPARQIRISPFYLDKAEVTNARYAAFVAKTGRTAPHQWPGGKVPSGKENFPVVNVTWEEAVAFCRWEGKRLPTEAEWERAARGMGDGSIYPWGNRPPTPKDARYDVLDGPGPVCRFPPNYFGLCDVAGNVWEWTADWYARDAYAVSPDANPQGPAEGRYRVIRGGSWFDQAKFLSCAYRSWARPLEKSPTIGFRCAKSFR